MKYSDLAINLAGIDICIKADASKNALRKDRLYFQSKSKKKPKAVFTELYSRFSDIDTKRFTLKVNNDFWSMHENCNTKIVTIKPSSRNKKIVAVLSNNMDKGDIYLWHKEDDWLNTRLWKIILDRTLAGSEVFTFHACAVLDGVDGYIFLGKSGAGKTTISKLWLKKNAQVMHDDRIIIYKENGRFMISSAEIFKNSLIDTHFPYRKAALKKIFFLKHGMKNKLIPKDYRETLDAMLQESLSLVWDRDVLRKMFYFHLDLASSISGYDLEFMPDETCINFIRNKFIKRG